MNNIETQVIEIAKKYSKKGQDISLQSYLKDDLKLDSLSLTEIVVACEDQFQIEIDLDTIDTKSLKKLFDVYFLVYQKVNAS
jgi:acyl carrier protein